jgi:tryptophanyl-tRNA synthetase
MDEAAVEITNEQTTLPAADAQSGDDAVVTAFEVKGAVDYERLITLFGSQPLTESLVERLERLTGTAAHYLIKRGIVFSHRDLGCLLDLYEKGTPFFLYTGR